MSTLNLKNKVTVINGESGEVIEREATLEEIAQRTKDAANFQIFKSEIESLQNAKEAAKASALAKLAALGLTEDEVNGLIS
jgi:hypothetical protein